MAAILEFCIKMKSKRQINIWFGILVIEFIEKMYLYKVISALVQNLIFQNGVVGHLLFWLLEKIARIFGRDMEAKFFIKGPKKSNRSSNLTSQRMVTESRFMTQLLWEVKPFHSPSYLAGPARYFIYLLLWYCTAHWQNTIQISIYKAQSLIDAMRTPARIQMSSDSVQTSTM